MTPQKIQGKGILVKLLEKSIEILLKKECKKIGKIEIDIIAKSIEIIQGIIQNIYIVAEEINYKDLLFDEIRLEANDVKIKFKLNNKELKLKNNFIIKFKISLSSNSLRKILSSNKWNWIGDMISRELLNQGKLEDVNIKNGQLLIKASKVKKSLIKIEQLDIKTIDGKLYLENKNYNKSIKIPFEDKVCIKNINIKNNLITIFANSSISF